MSSVLKYIGLIRCIAAPLHFIVALVLCIAGLAVRAPAQCPDRAVLWNRIAFLRDSTTTPPNAQLTELVPYVEKMRRCNYVRDSTYATLLQRIGALYYAQSDWDRSFDYMRQSIQVIRANEGSAAINLRHLIRFYYNLKLFFTSLGMPGAANNAADSCIAVAVKTGSGDPRTLTTLAERVEQLFDIGDYQRCIQYADVYAALPHERSPYLDKLSIRILSKKVNALNFLTQYDAALRLLKDSAGVFGRTAGQEFMGAMYGLLATANVGKGNFDEALTDFNRCFDISKKIRYKDGCAQALNNIGFLYQNSLRLPDKALPYYRKALAYADTIETLNILGNIANVYVQLGNYDSAKAYFRRAFDLSHAPGFKQNDYLIGLILDYGSFGLKFYQTRKTEANIGSLIAIFKRADRIFDNIGSEQSEIRSRLFWRSHTHRLYEQAIEACYLSGKPAEAYYFFEKSRAVLLADQLSEQHRSDAADILQLAQLRKKLLQAETLLNSLPDTSKQRAAIQGGLFTTRQELHRCEQSIRSRNPLYYQSFLDTSFITLSETQTQLSKDRQSLVELFTGDSADYCLLVTPGAVRLSRINKADFDSTAGLFTTYLSDPVRSNTAFGQYTGVASHLYQLLFGAAPPPDGRVIVSFDNRWIPFEALITRMTTTGPHYFLADHPVSYAYSFRYLSYTAATRAVSDGPVLLGVAPVHYSESLHLASLLGSEESLNRIASGFHQSDYLLSEKATRNNFMRDFHRYSVIQLYTHAAESSPGRNEPVIYFTDSALYLSDLLPENRPVTQLIVLSACETGSGHLYQGEGVFSFNRAFAALGIPSSVANLWAVDDQSTYRLTELFYRHLTAGLPVDQALQKAKLEFIGDGSGEKSLPYYWAAPVFAGDSSFTLGRSPQWTGWTALIELLLVALAALVILPRRHRRA